MVSESWKAIFRQVIAFDSSRVDSRVAFRNTIGVSCSLLAGFLMGQPLAGTVIALGALIVSYSDRRDPYISRARRMLSSSALCTVTVFIAGFLIKDRLIAAIVATGWAFMAGMLVAIDATVADLGIFSFVMFLVFAGQHLTFDKALALSAMTLAGGLLQTFLTLLYWPIRGLNPERQELGKLFFELAKLAEMPVRSKEEILPAAFR